MATLLLDLDGTIVDSGPGILGSFKATIDAMGGVPPADQDLRWVIGPPLRPTFAKLLGGTERVEACVEHYRSHYAQHGLAASEPYVGVGEELRRLHADGYTLFVCTSKVAPFARVIIERIGLGGLFTGIYGADPGGAGDDKGELIARIVSEHGLDPRHSGMIGDRREDILAGRKNDLATVGVLWGYGGEAELAAAGATALCATAADLTPVIARLFMSPAP